MSQQMQLCGWGRTAPSVATVVDATVDEVRRAGGPAALGDRGVIARGLGRAYGDAAQNGGGTVLRLAGSRWSLDEEAGTVTASAGTSFDELMRDLVPRGWFVPVSPGTRFVTVGGAIATDIHGKNHHVDGSFGSHVTALELLLADGSVVDLTPDAGELWWATIGGMGLTGVITSATFRLLPIETSRCLVETSRVPDLDALLTRMEDGDADHRYSVAWVDMVATGARLGRAVLTRGDHATSDQFAAHGGRGDQLAFDPGALAGVPSGVPNVLSRPAVRTFNELWYRRAPRARTALETITGFFHPLDAIGDWNRLYGRGGFIQYQFVVPFERVDTLRSIVIDVAESGQASFLAVLKRLGPASGGMLSFPMPGWTLTLDLPAASDGLASLVRRLDEQVLAAGGRHYLAKDATASPGLIRRSYPELDEWRRVRCAVDPHGVWTSDQARRLELI